MPSLELTKHAPIRKSRQREIVERLQPYVD
jgi:hypothetical protein